MPINKILSTIFIISFFFASTLYAHSGGTDSNGGHTNRKTGEYHYHSGNKTTTAEIISIQESGAKTTTRNTKMFVVGDGSIGFSEKQLKPNIKTIFRGKVVGVTDGDTIKVLKNGKLVKIRLYGVDTPEKKQAFGQDAKRFTTDMVAGKTVGVEPIDIDRYGRTVGLVRVDGANLNKELVRNGYAWVYSRYCKKGFCEDWKSLETKVRSNGVGLWGEPEPLAPWDWRKKKGNR